MTTVISTDPKLDEHVFWNACLDHYNCRALFGQLVQSNFTQFDQIANIMVPQWPNDPDTIVARMQQDPKYAMQQYLIASACSEQCAFNQKRVGTTCVEVDVGEVPSSTFVTVVMIAFAIIVLIGVVTYVARACDEFFTDPRKLAREDAPELKPAPPVQENPAAIPKDIQHEGRAANAIAPPEVEPAKGARVNRRARPTNASALLQLLRSSPPPQRRGAGRGANYYHHHP